MANEMDNGDYGQKQSTAVAAVAPSVVSRSESEYGRRGIELRSIADAWRFAECVFQSGLAPKGFGNAQAVLVAIQMGAEVGLPPMAAIQNIAVIGNRPSIWGDAMLAVCRNCGVFDDAAFNEEIYADEKGGGLTARCTCRRLPSGKLVVQTFSERDAKTAGLWGKAGPWIQYPRRMLQMRARSFALRDAFGDALRGLLSREEVEEATRPATVEAVVESMGGTVVEGKADLPPIDEPRPEQRPTSRRTRAEQRTAATVEDLA